MEFPDQRTASILSTILLFVVAGAFVYAARDVLIAFLFAILFAFLLDPLVSRLQSWALVSRGSRSMAILEVYAILCLTVPVVLLSIGPGIGDEGRRLAATMPGLFEKVGSGQIALQMGRTGGWSSNTQLGLQQFLASHANATLGWFTAAGSRVAKFAQNLIWIVLIPIVAIFFLKDGRRFAENLLELFERKRQRQFLAGITQDLNNMLAPYIRSQLTPAGPPPALPITVPRIPPMPYHSSSSLLSQL